MKSIRFEHALEIAVAPARLHDFLSALENFSALHPLIESITRLAADPARPAARRYRVVDQIPIGPLRMKTIYRAEIEPISTNEIRGEAWQSPGVHLVTTYHLEPTAPGTRLRESVVVEAPFGLRRFVAHQASTSHRTTLEGIKALLERESRA